MNDPVSRAVSGKGGAKPLKLYKIKSEPALDPTGQTRALMGYHAPTLDDYLRISLLEALDLDMRDAEFFIDLTFFCNLKCNYCAVSSKERIALDWKQSLIPIKAMSLMGVRSAGLGGGEPGIYQHTPKVLQDLRDLKIETTVFTNGIWAKSQRKLETFMRARPRGFMVSYKAFNEDDYKKLTGVPVPTSVMKQALGNFSRRFQQGEFQDFKVNHVVTSLSVKNLSEMLWLMDLPSPPTMILTMVEPHSLSAIEIYPDPRALIKSFSSLLPALDKSAITYIFDSFPLCLLGERWGKSLDVNRFIDRRTRIYFRPRPDGDQILIHKGYQRLIQYGYLKECDSCAKRAVCPGIHKRAMKYYKNGVLTPFQH